MNSRMGPHRPYLLRAYYDWLVDNDLTPYVVVDALVSGTQVPQQFVKDGQIVLNISMTAVADLKLGNDVVEFNARFGGISQQVVLPLAAIIAIYACENGAGVVFDMEDAYAASSDEAASVDTTDSENITDKDDSVELEKADLPTKKHSHLTLIK